MRPASACRAGFTLVELLVAISIFVILTALTIGAVNLSITSERVRGAARSIQSKIEGARDRAVYESRRNPDNVQPVGIRLLVDPSEPTICTSIVYIQSPGNETSTQDTSDIDNDGDTTELATFAQVVLWTIPPPVGITLTAVIGGGVDPPGAAPPVPPPWRSLYERGLIGPGSVITINGVTDTIHPASFPVLNESDHFSSDVNGNGVDDPVLFTIRQHPDASAGTVSNPFEFSIPLNPDVRPNEEQLTLPRGTCIDLRTSHLPDGWLTVNPSTGQLQFSNRMDILFSAKGNVVGDAAAAGIIHLHVVDMRDALAGALPGSPTLPVDADADGLPDPRNGDELGITIFTKSGRVITHPLAFQDLYEPSDPTNADGKYYPPRGDLTPALGFGNGRETWTAGTSYSADDVVAPTIYNGLIFRAVRFQTGAAGTSGTSEPKWNLAPGGLTRDGQVIWQSIKHDVWELGLQGEVAK